MEEYKLSSSSSQQTEQIGQKIGKNLKGGEVIVLQSDLGGGKTTLVRGLALGAGADGHVSSPTFTLSKEYTAPKLTIHHYDFYRLQDPGIMMHEIEEVLHDPSAVVVVEWGEIVRGILPEAKLVIKIMKSGELTRSLRMSTAGEVNYLLDGVC